jgi:flagellar biosynthesis/type III secretory pathway chaperone
MTTPTPKFFDQSEWEPLVEILRDELQEYGGLFNLLNQQQEGIIERRPDDVLAINAEIEEQTRIVEALRHRHTDLVDHFFERSGGEGAGTLRKIIPFFPDSVRPLLEALMTDVNHMVRRNRQKARQNHLLLSRSMELTEQTLRVLQPENFTRTYKRTGKVSMAGRGKSASRYHQVG